MEAIDMMMFLAQKAKGVSILRDPIFFPMLPSMIRAGLEKRSSEACSFSLSPHHSRPSSKQTINIYCSVKSRYVLQSKTEKNPETVLLKYLFCNTISTAQQ